MITNLLAVSPEPIFPFKDPVYILSIVLLIIAIAPIISQRLQIPTLIVLILLGAIFGTNVLGIIERDKQLILLEKFGLLYVMFLAGLQMNLSNIKRLGMRSLTFGLLTFIIPLGLGIMTGKLMSYGTISALLLGIIYSPHTLISYPIVTKLGINDKEAVNVAVGGTIVTSILTLASLSIIQSITQGNLGAFLWFKLLVLLPIIIFIYFKFVLTIGKNVLANNRDYSNKQIVFSLSCLFLGASITLILGVDSIIGAFAAGLALNQLIPINSTLMNRLDLLGNSLFIPMFLVSVGVLCNPQVLFAHPESLFVALSVIIGAISAKFMAAWIAGKANNYSLDEVMVMTGLTMSRAALVLVIALFGKNAQILNDVIFNAIVLYIIVTCLTGPLITNAFAQRCLNLQISQKSCFSQPES
jgi:Kef-type K+ transport system membrane component KefB